MFDRYYCIKIENICYISPYFLHYFVMPFHQCLANAVSTDYARSGTPGSGNKQLTIADRFESVGIIGWPRYEHMESCVAMH